MERKMKTYKEVIDESAALSSPDALHHHIHKYGNTKHTVTPNAGHVHTVYGGPDHARLDRSLKSRGFIRHSTEHDHTHKVYVHPTGHYEVHSEQGWERGQREVTVHPKGTEGGKLYKD
jgi:hypothetical protein